MQAADLRLCRTLALTSRVYAETEHDTFVKAVQVASMNAPGRLWGGGQLVAADTGLHLRWSSGSRRIPDVGTPLRWLQRRDELVADRVELSPTARAFADRRGYAVSLSACDS